MLLIRACHQNDKSTNFKSLPKHFYGIFTGWNQWIVFWKPGRINNFVGLGQLTMIEFTVGTVSSHMETNRKFHQEKQLLDEFGAGPYLHSKRRGVLFLVAD